MKRQEPMKTLLSSLLACCCLAAAGHAVAATTADDVKCQQCVHNVDIKQNTIKSGKIRDGEVKTVDLADSAVTSAKIGDGEVGNDDLADAAVDGRTIKANSIKKGKLDKNLREFVEEHQYAYDYRDYDASDITRKVFRLVGGFGDCSAGTEVYNITRSALGGGVTEVTQEVLRYARNARGTLCFKYVDYYIEDKNYRMLVKRDVYDSAGTTILETYETDYDAATCDDCGIIYGTSDMSYGRPVTSFTLVEETVGGGDGPEGMVINKTELVEGDTTFTMRSFAGKVKEDFDECQTIWEDRNSNVLGNVVNMKTFCKDVGLVSLAQSRRSDARPRYRELISYTRAQP